MSPAPAPFIVGVPRSGTTLLRLMLDAHPLLAIPPETALLPAALALPAGAGLEELLRLVTAFETWPDFHLRADELEAALRAVVPFSVADGLRAFYRRYAARFGKPRWGDKTPFYGAHLRAIHSRLPEARFIHLLRDGRDVALSVRPMWFAPAQDAAALARDWVTQVRMTREQARGLPYFEARYEELVREPEPTLRRVCEFLDLRFEPAMLRYYERAGARLEEHEERRAPDGSLWLSKDRRRRQQWRAQRPPDASRIARFRSEMGPQELEAFERVAGELLRELGYEPGQPRGVDAVPDPEATRGLESGPMTRTEAGA